MNEKEIQVLLDELLDKKIVNKQENGYKITDEFARRVAINSSNFKSVSAGLVVSIIEWIKIPIEIEILEYYDVLYCMIEAKKMEFMLKV